MTGPKAPSDPAGEDWGFPEVDPAAPTSFDMPEPEEVYDTGSDAWWRAQAHAQREAADSQSPSAPAEAVTSPLDRDWYPPELVTPAPAPAPEAAAEPKPNPEPDPEPEPEGPPVAPTRTPRATASRAPRPTPPPPPPAVPPAPAPAPEATAEATAPPQLEELEVPVAAAALPDHAVKRPPHQGAPVGPARAVAGAAIALIGVLLGVGALYLFNKHDDKGSPVVASPPLASATASSTPTPQGSPTPSRGPTSVPSQLPSAVPPVATQSPAAAVVPVSVLNNSRIKGLADQRAARFRAGGWPVRLTGNYRGGTISRTTVYYAPDELASAQRFARQFGIPRVAPRFRGLPTTGMTVVVTRDYR